MNDGEYIVDDFFASLYEVAEELAELEQSKDEQLRHLKEGDSVGLSSCNLVANQVAIK